MPSALQNVFREWTLEYEAPDGTTTTDAYGNPVPNTTTSELVINFEPSRSDMLIFQPGADLTRVAGRATCINPSTLPGVLGVGSELAMTLNGQAGTLRIVSLQLDPLAVLDDVLGQEFAAEWRAA